VASSPEIPSERVDVETGVGSWLRGHWEDSRATESERESHRAAQLDGTVRLGVASSCMHHGAIALYLWLGWGLGVLKYALLWAGATSLCSLTSLWFLKRGAAEHDAHTNNHYLKQTRAYGIASVLLAGLLSAYPAWLFVASGGHTRLVVGCLIIACIGVGSLALAHLPQIGVPWISMFTLAATLALLWTGDLLLRITAFVLLWYGAMHAYYVLLTSRNFLRGLQLQSKLTNHADVIGLLLNDFEREASDWLWETDADGKLRHVPLRLATVLGESIDALTDRTLSEVLRGPFRHLREEERSAFDAFERALSKHVPFRELPVPTMSAGSVRWYAITGKPLLNAKQAFAGWRGVGSDITERRNNQIDLERLANVDPLTGIANRRRFQDALEQQFPAAEAILPSTLLLLDLDHFKEVNDSLGHQAGDALLQTVASRLANCVGPTDVLARLGGDEFALLIRAELAHADALALGQRAIDALLQGHDAIGGSIGISSAPLIAKNASDLLKTSDVALYAAKAGGRGTVRYYDATYAQASARRNEIGREMRGGLQQFTPHYQPQVRADGNVVAMEALARFSHRTMGAISPSEFIPIAEELGLVGDLGAHILLKACRDAAKWPTTVCVSVNVSAMQLRREFFVREVLQALSESGLDPARLELELTESALVHDFDRVARTLKELRGHGIRISLDDFGTGFSSLSYLRTLPLDRIKLDRSFVELLDHQVEGPRTRAIVRAVIELAAALSFEIVAEGVETQRQREVLAELGCDCIQGWLIAKSMPPREAVQWMEANEAKRLSLPTAEAPPQQG
jgi:diguanylate cyclase (GGDEF)-like protein